MATPKQIAANQRNAAKSTGPRTEQGKARSRMNALRHGLAIADQDIVDQVGPDSGIKKMNMVHERLLRIDAERFEMLREIESLLLCQQSEKFHVAFRRLGALERYARRSYSWLKKQT